jgi:hypothetical protein
MEPGQSTLFHCKDVLDVHVGRRPTLIAEQLCDVLNIDARLLWMHWGGGWCEAPLQRTALLCKAQRDIDAPKPYCCHAKPKITLQHFP